MLHPFKDGNGRVGRILVTLLLWQLGGISKPLFYVSRFFEEHKADYIHHMREASSSRAWENWCIFFLGAVKEQAFQNLQFAESTRNLYEEMKGRFTELLNSAKAVTALDYIFTNPVFRNSRFTQHAGIPPPASLASCWNRISSSPSAKPLDANPPSIASSHGFVSVLKSTPR